MKSNTKVKIIQPWNIKGYVKLSFIARKQIENYINQFKNKYKASRSLGLPPYWSDNFLKRDKINSIWIKNLILKFNDSSLINEVEEFYDDKGYSSFPYKRKFPIRYNPQWHFLFCLSVGDGYFSNEKKPRFVWYQKKEGLLLIKKFIQKMGFDYNPTILKNSIVMPLFIIKLGQYITGLQSKEEITNNIVRVSSKLGKEYEIAFLMAFFLAEAGMSKAKKTPEITLHQEGNLELLEKIGQLLTKHDIKWNKNQKGEGWVIRISSKSFPKLKKLFDSLKKYDLSLFHRQKIFEEKISFVKVIP